MAVLLSTLAQVTPWITVTPLEDLLLDQVAPLSKQLLQVRHGTSIAMPILHTKQLLMAMSHLLALVMESCNRLSLVQIH